MPERETISSNRVITITVTYDNNSYDKRLKTDWGFSCVVQGFEKTILFDTGGDNETLLSNMAQLGVDPKKIDIIVLSHIHGDHTGGLSGFLKKNNNVTVYVPASFPQGFKDDIKSVGVKVEEIGVAREFFGEVYSTGELGNGIKEQSLAISTTSGTIIITGCAHPGIVNVIRKSKELVNGKVYLVIGGFHLGGTGDRELKQIIKDFKQLELINVGPCHCSGDWAREVFKEAYGEYFLSVGVGRKIILKDTGNLKMD